MKRLLAFLLITSMASAEIPVWRLEEMINDTYHLKPKSELTLHDLTKIDDKNGDRPIVIKLERESAMPDWAWFMTGGIVGGLVMTAVIGVFYYQRNK